MNYTYKDVIYLVLNELKQTSDDIQLEEGELAVLLNIARAVVLKQRLGNNKVEIPREVIQTIPFKISLKESTLISDRNFNTLNLNGNHLFYNVILDLYPDKFVELVTLDRFKYVYNNKWLQNIVYATIGKTNKIYLKAPSDIMAEFTNPSVKINATFEGILDDPREAYPYEDNYLDLDFAINSDLLRPIIELVIADIVKHMSIPEDIVNNGKNDQQIKQ